MLRVIARLNVGGPALHVSLLTARLDPERFDSLLAAGIPGEREGNMLDLRPRLRAEVGERLVTIGALGREVGVIRDIKAAAELTRIIRNFRPHVLHTHTAKAGALGRVLARATAVPFVVHTFHGTVFDGHFQPGVGKAVALVERALAHLTDAIVAVSPAVAQQLRDRRIGVDRLRVLPVGLDLAVRRGRGDRRASARGGCAHRVWWR